MSNSDVTLKVTQSYTFLFKFDFDIPKLTYNEIQKKIIIRKISKTSSFQQNLHFYSKKWPKNKSGAANTASNK